MDVGGGKFHRTDHRQKCRSQGPAQRQPLRFQHLVFSPSSIVLLLPLPPQPPCLQPTSPSGALRGLPRALPPAQCGVSCTVPVFQGGKPRLQRVKGRTLGTLECNPSVAPMGKPRPGEDFSALLLSGGSACSPQSTCPACAARIAHWVPAPRHTWGGSVGRGPHVPPAISKTAEWGRSAAHRRQPLLHAKSLPFSYLMNTFQTRRASLDAAKFVLTGVARLWDAAPLISLRFEVPRPPLISTRFEIREF